MKTLVLGGYGNFGARICRALAADPAIELLIGGRDVQRARALADELGKGAQGVAMDHAAPDLELRLRERGVGLLIHTAGPFQQQAYHVAQAAARAGAHYIDLADGRRFVCDFSAAMDAEFRLAGRSAFSGASTVPALSSAVINHLCKAWQRIDSIDICIAPAQTAPRGQATLEAVLGYCGEPMQVLSGGQWQTQSGWSKLERVHFKRLKSRWGALCDIPDLELFPLHYRATQRVMFRAALEVGFMQRALALIAGLRQWGIITQPSKWAGAANALAKAFDGLGSSLGGMVVQVEGVDASGRAARAAWHIAADHDHGPEIPCMATILLARQLARGDTFPIGASACMGAVKLDEFAPEFARWGMVTDVVVEPLL